MTDLTSPFDLGGLPLPNRTVMAPMTRTRAAEDGTPTALMAEYYAQRASAGLIVTECTEVSPVARGGRGILRAPGIHDATHVEGWKPVVDAVHAAGGRIFLQLWHPGRVSHPALLDGAAPVAPSAVTAQGTIFLPGGERAPFTEPRVLDLAAIAPIIEDFARGAANARAAGFDGIELHGAFGYLPDQFLQDGTNRRTDAYGGPVANRSRFLLEVMEVLVGVWGAGRVGVKLSPSNRFYGIHDTDARATFGHVVQALDAMGVAYLHLMEPNVTDLQSGTLQIDQVVETFRPLTSVPIIANGGFDRAKANAVLRAGSTDLVSFGVPFLANPDLPARLASGAPLNTPDPATFYGEGPKGYTDYPVRAAA